MGAMRGYRQRWPLVAAVLALAACAAEQVTPPDTHKLAVGTWGGENVGVIVGDTSAHVHIGCTNGYFHAPIPLDQLRFEAVGYYYPRVHPVAVGPAVPARIMGSVSGNVVTFTVVVNDTVEKRTVTLGPNTATFGREPRMGPCPICVAAKR